jgi:DNA-binding SARP family transcriptional activator/tetratricopeptide (TPR) repeat protein
LTAATGREATVLAMLALHAGRPVPADWLAGAVWSSTAPRDSRGQVHGCVSRLRRKLAAGVIVTDPAGYRLVVDDPRQIDLLAFRDLVDQARAAAGARLAEQARRHYRDALGLWRGPALAGLGSPTVRRLAAGLDEEHLRAREECFDLELSMDAGGELAPELTDLCQRHPYREALHRALMLTLFRAGRQADALAAYQRVRTQLVTELGQEPGPALRQLHQRILVGDESLLPDHGHPSTAPTAQAGRCLPRTIGDFTGRETELAWVDDAARNPDPYAPLILAIDGMPGVGKTSLAVRAAHLLADSYPDGQLFIDLHGHSEQGPVQPTAALGTLLRQLGTPPSQVPTDLDERVERWRSTLAGRRILLLLDNAATTTQITPLLPAGAGALVLVTSRRRLLDLTGARTLTMDTLLPDEAVAILARIAGDRVLAEPESAAEVAKRCGHLPLALRMAAARLAHRPHWRVRDLADRLADPHQPLTGLAAGDHTIADAFTLSYYQLTPGTQRTFRLLGLHPGEDLDPHVAAALTGATLAEARQDLDELVDAHLLDEVHAHRYRLHDLVRTYASQLTRAADPDHDRDTAIRGLLDYYLHATAAATEHIETSLSRRNFQPGEPSRPDLIKEHANWAIAWLDTERPNIVAAVRLAADLGQHRYAWMLPAAVWRYLYLQGYLSELLETHHLALAAAEHLGDPDAAATLRNILAFACLRVGNPADAIEHMRYVTARRARTGDRVAEAISRRNLAVAYAEAGHHRDAAEEAERALIAARVSGDIAALAGTLANVGHIHLVLGRYTTALRHSRHGLALAREAGDDFYRAVALDNAGTARARLGQYQPALRLLRAAAGLMHDTSNRYTRADTLSHLGEVYRALGRLDDALAHHREALEMMRQAGDRKGEYAVCNELARTLHATGDTQAALDLHRRALAGTTKIGHKYGQARALDGIATCLRDTDPTAAGHHWVRALRLYLELDAPERDQVHRDLAALHG